MNKPQATMTEWKIVHDPWAKANTFSLKGCVHNHPHLEDCSDIETTELLGYDIKDDTIIFHSQNTDYLCKLTDKNPYEPDEFETYVIEFKGKMDKYIQIEDIDLENNSILIELSNFYDYYLRRVCMKRENIISFGRLQVHNGMVRDSCLLSFENGVDIRFFPSYQHLKQYCWQNKGLDVYFENRGSMDMFVTTPIGVLKLIPGQRSLVHEGTILPTEDIPHLDTSNLYPTPIVNFDANIGRLFK